MRKTIIAVAASLLSLAIIMMAFAGCGAKNNSSKTEDAKQTSDYEKMKDTAQKLVSEDECTFIVIRPMAHGEMVFDTHSGVVFFRGYGAYNSIGGMAVLYQNDGVTPRNVYHQNEIWTTSEKAEYLLKNYWDDIKPYK